MSGTTLFISDLHLQLEAPQVTERFLQFLKQEAPQADALYILGDFFEAWIGDDDRTEFHEQIIERLKEISAKMPVYFMHGNRDFLIGSRFAKRTGITILPDPSLVEIYGHKILLTHGDILCTLDTRHQKYRRTAFNPIVQKCFLVIPLWIRRKIANFLRHSSQRHNKNTPSHITDVTPSEAQRLMQQHNVTLMVHGHTHRPKIHDLQINNKLAHRIVLGAWHDQADYLCFNSDGTYQLVPLIVSHK